MPAVLIKRSPSGSNIPLYGQTSSPIQDPHYFNELSRPLSKNIPKFAVVARKVLQLPKPLPKQILNDAVVVIKENQLSETPSSSGLTKSPVYISDQSTTPTREVSLLGDKPIQNTCPEYISMSQFGSKLSKLTKSRKLVLPVDVVCETKIKCLQNIEEFNSHASVTTLKEALHLQIVKNGPCHLNVTRMMHAIAIAQCDHCQYGNAISCLKNAVELVLQRGGDNMDELAHLLSTLGNIYRKRGMLKEALNCYKRALMEMNGGEESRKIAMMKRIIRRVEAQII